MSVLINTSIKQTMQTICYSQQKQYYLCLSATHAMGYIAYCISLLQVFHRKITRYCSVHKLFNIYSFTTCFINEVQQLACNLFRPFTAASWNRRTSSKSLVTGPVGAYTCKSRVKHNIIANNNYNVVINIRMNNCASTAVKSIIIWYIN